MPSEDAAVLLCKQLIWKVALEIMAYICTSLFQQAELVYKQTFLVFETQDRFIIKVKIKNLKNSNEVLSATSELEIQGWKYRGIGQH